MKPHPRIRKAVKWGGAVVSVLLLVVWIGSGWYLVRWGLAPGWAVFTECGVSDVVYAPSFYNGSGRPSIERRIQSFSPAPAPFALGWRYRYDVYGKPNTWEGQETHWWIPLWPVPLIACLVTAVAWRLDTLARRRAKLGACPNCSYSRTGLAPTALCPECGTPVLSPPPSAS